MILFNEDTLLRIALKFPQAKENLLNWYKMMNNHKFGNVNELKSVYRTASVLKNHRLCFNISGNKYRLIVKSDFKTSRIFIKWFGTHQEYDRINVHEAENYKSF